MDYEDLKARVEKLEAQMKQKMGVFQLMIFLISAMVVYAITRSLF